MMLHSIYTIHNSEIKWVTVRRLSYSPLSSSHTHFLLLLSQLSFKLYLSLSRMHRRGVNFSLSTSNTLVTRATQAASLRSQFGRRSSSFDQVMKSTFPPRVLLSSLLVGVITCPPQLSWKFAFYFFIFIFLISLFLVLKLLSWTHYFVWCHQWSHLIMSRNCWLLLKHLHQGSVNSLPCFTLSIKSSLHQPPSFATISKSFSLLL